MAGNDGEKYPVYCAWCRAEGIETIIGMTIIPGSDGICEWHSQEVVAQVQAYREAFRKMVAEDAALLKAGKNADTD